ncbi:hypothetical protein [Novosphingobium mangrovi (ex Hu et al. 2023)]|uniref:Uncharacterized protein n=1 Tax=Novosphingobium mangrovi (ex Hu et al. 2023) TaxID=2930094 RepID=A0ABT0AGV8_9SPHN|nr:hypothetical protein [Novosphingobium mangrovi (ex Hu et al. 2023)]MCJ1962446.1 hypothetical protein [Novosphingobium mangrovi (ex Hu et al. 2023)]
MTFPSLFLLSTRYAPLIAARQAAVVSARPPAGGATPPFPALDFDTSAWIEIRFPGLLPVDVRGDAFEVPLEAALATHDLGSVDGGGSWADGFSEILVKASGPGSAVDVVLEILAKRDIPACTEVWYESRDYTVILSFNGLTWDVITSDEALTEFIGRSLSAGGDSG